MISKKGLLFVSYTRLTNRAKPFVPKPRASAAPRPNRKCSPSLLSLSSPLLAGLKRSELTSTSVALSLSLALIVRQPTGPKVSHATKSAVLNLIRLLLTYISQGPKPPARSTASGDNLSDLEKLWLHGNDNAQCACPRTRSNSSREITTSHNKNIFLSHLNPNETCSFTFGGCSS